MSTFPLRKRMRSPAEQARALALGHTPLGRAMGTLCAIIAIGMASGFALGQTGPVASAWLLGLCSVIAGWYSIQATGAAARAQQVMASSLAPTTAMRAWRRGWLQVEGILWMVFAAGCLSVIARHDGFGSQVWIVPGAVLTAQSAGVWAALASRGRAPQACHAAPGLWAIAFVLYVREEWDGAFAVPPWGVALLLLLGAASLLAAYRLLGPLARLRVRPMRPTGTKSALRLYLQRWTPLSVSPGGYWWQPWYGVALVSLYSILQGPGGFGPIASLALPMRIFWLFLFTGVCSTTLSVQGLHWRQWLLPGGPLRNRIGTELFRSTTKMYLVVLAPLAVLSVLVAWLFGMAPHDIFTHVEHGMMMVAELAFAIAAADALAAVLKGRMNKAGAWIVFGLVLVAGLSLAWVVYTLKAWRLDGTTERWPQAGLSYALALLAVTPVLVAAANLLWRRRDLHDLIRRSTSA